MLQSNKWGDLIFSSDVEFSLISEWAWLFDFQANVTHLFLISKSICR